MTDKLVELKAKTWDLGMQIQTLQQELQRVNQEIVRILQEPAPLPLPKKEENALSA